MTMRGTNIHPIWWDPNTGPSAADRVQLMVADGITHARMDVPWSRVEQTEGVYHAGYMARLDAAVSAMRAAGIVPLVVVTACPGWANGGQSEFTPPTTNETYARFVGMLVRRWKAPLDVEVWNEASYPGFWVTGTAKRYGELLRQVYPFVKGIDPTVTVIGGSLHNSNDPRATDFATALLGDARGYRQYVDAWSVHSYGDPPGRASRWPFDVVRDVMRNIAPILNPAGQTPKPLWLTETGYNTVGMDADRKAAGDADLRRWADRLLGPGSRCYLYEFFDSGTDAAQPEQRYGAATSPSPTAALRPGYAA